MILHSATQHGNHSPFGVVVSMLGASWSIMENMQQPCGFALIFHWVSSVVSWIPLHYSKGFFYVMASGMNNPTAYWTAWSVESLKNPNLITCPFVTGNLCVWIPLSRNIESISMASMSHHGMMCERIFTFYYCMIFCRYLRILIYSTSFFLAFKHRRLTKFTPKKTRIYPHLTSSI